MDTLVDSVRPLEQLEAVICQGAANLTAAEHGWLLAVAEFDRREGWQLWECQSCAAWLSWQIGLDIRAAREKVRVARALEALPAISTAMAAGRLSYSKVRAITRIATGECEQALVDMALAGTTNHVERIVSAYRRAEPVAVEREQAQHDRRGLRHHVDDDGSIVMTIRLTAEAGTAVLSAIEQFTAPPSVDADGTRVSLSQRRADALVDMVEVAAQPTTSGSPRYLAHLHVTASALAGGDGCCEIDGHGEAIDTPVGVSAETALRMLCDADLQLVVTDHNGSVLQVSQRVGLVTGKRRREVLARDNHQCRVPGCSRRARLDVHHIIHRAHHGSNDLSNLLVLCRFHHHRFHEGGWKVVTGPHGFEFHSPNGRRITEHPTTVAGDPDPVARHQRNATDGRCRWGGERLDLDMALTALFSRTHPEPMVGVESAQEIRLSAAATAISVSSVN